jgi:hypothetical protein
VARTVSQARPSLHDLTPTRGPPGAVTVPDRCGRNPSGSRDGSGAIVVRVARKPPSTVASGRPRGGSKASSAIGRLTRSEVTSNDTMVSPGRSTTPWAAAQRGRQASSAARTLDDEWDQVVGVEPHLDRVGRVDGPQRGRLAQPGQERRHLGGGNRDAHGPVPGDGADAEAGPARRGPRGRSCRPGVTSSSGIGALAEKGSRPVTEVTQRAIDSGQLTRPATGEHSRRVCCHHASRSTTRVLPPSTLSARVSGAS